ncbi:MAG: hypothetical protein JO169_05375 [Solirubrobacterales bacterium]|nr:hypothetical protein [Solirubrobacterales bacterium]
MATTLGQKDLRTVLELAHRAHACESLFSLREEMLGGGLRQLVPYDSIGYNEIDLEARSALGIIDPPEVEFERFAETFLVVAPQHPLVLRQQGGDLRTGTLSDHLSPRQFHELELYHDFYKRIEVEDQLAFGLPGEVITAFALCRSRRSFTERDRAALELLRPHLASAYEHARERERVCALVAALESGLERRHMAVIQLDGRGGIEHASPTALELLSAYFGSASETTLPRALEAWLGSANGSGSSHELTVTGARGRLHVRAHSSRGTVPWRMLQFSEHRAGPPSLVALRELGLTERQTQVSRLLACGKRSEQIARELGISAKTVTKHLEHIYATLGVTNRAQALARVYGST